MSINYKNCNYCNIVLDKNIYELHLKHCKKLYYNCDSCKENILLSKKEEHNKEYHLELKCKFCNIIIYNFNKEEHLKNYHPLIRCELCKEILGCIKAEEYTNHLINKCKFRLHKCYYCNNKYKYNEIEEHELICNNKNKKCEYCNIIVKKELHDLHIRHCKSKSKSKSKNENKKENQNIIKTNNNLYTCDICNKSIPIKNKESHIIENHSNIACNKCNLIINKNDFKTHKCIEKNIKCKFCDINYESDEKLTIHIKNCKLRIIKCYYCDDEYEFCNLVSHANKCGAETDNCIYCNKRILKSEMKLHILEIHNFNENNKTFEDIFNELMEFNLLLN